MRLSLLYNPLDLIDRLAVAIRRRRRRRRLRHTPAAQLSLGHIDSLELLELLTAEPPAVIYDIGANAGTWSCLAKSLFPAARLEAFEPLPRYAASFRKLTAAWPGQVHLHPCALGAVEGTATMQIMNLEDASSLLPVAAEGRREFNLQTVAEQIVPVLPLDVLVSREKLPFPDLLKLDVQGYELEVLRGAEACLHHARAVICEVSFRQYYERQPLFSDLLRFLAERGFTLHALGQGTALGQPLIQADALFVRAGPDRP